MEKQDDLVDRRGCAPKFSFDADDAKCEGCPSSEVVRERRRFSPLAWVAAPSLRLGHVFAFIHERLLGSQGEERETRDE